MGRTFNGLFIHQNRRIPDLEDTTWRCLIVFYLGRCGSQVTIEPAWRQQHSQSQGAYTTLAKLTLHYQWEIETHKSKMSQTRHNYNRALIKVTI